MALGAECRVQLNRRGLQLKHMVGVGAALCPPPPLTARTCAVADSCYRNSALCFSHPFLYCNGLCRILERNCLKLDWKFHLKNTLKCKKKKPLSHRHATCKTHKPTHKHKETILQTYEDTKRPAHEVDSKRETSE